MAQASGVAMLELLSLKLADWARPRRWTYEVPACVGWSVSST